MTNLESDISTPALEESDSDGFVESESEPLTCLLDARLLVVLGYDLELAARLIPRIHDLIQRNFASGGVDVRVVPSQATGTTGTTGQTSGASVIRSSISASSTAKGTELKRLKHKHDSEEDDEEANGNKRSKRHRKRWDPALPRPRGFACPFHRKDPEKYAPTTDIKYRTCIGPGPTELRRIKYACLAGVAIVQIPLVLCSHTIETISAYLIDLHNVKDATTYSRMSLNSPSTDVQSPRVLRRELNSRKASMMASGR